MGLKVEVDSRAFEKALRSFEKKVKGDTTKFIVQQSGTFISEVIKHTYPKKASEGKNAVKGDLARAVELLDFSKIKDPRLMEKLKSLARRRDYEGIEKIMKNWNARGGVDVMRFTPGLHSRARNARGKVRRKTGRATVDSRAWKQHRSRKMKRVGLLKHGWVGAGKRLKRYGATVRMPAWVVKDKDGMRTGTARRVGRGNRIMFIMENPYDYYPGYERTVDFVLGLRRKKMGRDIVRIVKGGANRYGLTVR